MCRRAEQECKLLTGQEGGALEHIARSRQRMSAGVVDALCPTKGFLVTIGTQDESNGMEWCKRNNLCIYKKIEGLKAK